MYIDFLEGRFIIWKEVKIVLITVVKFFFVILIRL